MKARTMLLTAIAAATVAASGVAMGGDIYVTNYATGGFDGTIGLYTTTGETVNPALVTGLHGPSGLAVSGSRLFVALYGAGTIGEYDLSTGAAVNPAFISVGHNLSDVVVSGSSLFLTDYNAGTIGQYDLSTGAVVNATLVSGLSRPSGLLVYGSNLLVVDTGNGAVGEYTMTGATVDAKLVAGLNLASGGGMAIAGSHLFITDTANNTVNEYDVDTGAAVNAPLVSGLSYPSAIALSGPDMLIVSQHAPYTIGQYTLSGSMVNSALVAGLNVPVDMLVLPEPPTLTSWIASSGPWQDANGWTTGVPGAGMQATITNGGTAQIAQADGACSELILGSAPSESGTVQMMTGSRLDTSWVTVGLRGAGTFLQTDGDLHVRHVLSIGAESNSVGAYALQGGSLFAGDIVVGGSASAKGGAGTLTISDGNAIVDGMLRVWSGSTVNLGRGGLVSSDASHPALDLYNDGTVEVGDANAKAVVYCFRGVTGDGNIVIDAGATVWVESLGDNSAWINAGGRLILSVENPTLYAATATSLYVAAVPEPASLTLLFLGGLLLARRRR